MSEPQESGSEQRRCPSCGGFMPEDRGSEICINCDDGLRADGGPQQAGSDRKRQCEAEDCEEPAVEVHIPVEGAVEYEPHDLCEEHAAMTNNKVRDIPRTDGGVDQSGTERKPCPYCEDGELEPMEDMGATHQCTNVGACPATFVAVLGGGRGV